MKAASRKGFTLIEILIVVIILGILAAIVIPQFTNASDDARKSSTASQLQTLRSAVELYKLQHGDTYPTSAGTDVGTVTTPLDWTKLLGTSLSYDGKTVGPYMQQTPVNPLAGSATPVFGTTANSGDGWLIQADGRIFAVDKAGKVLTY